MIIGELWPTSRGQQGYSAVRGIVAKRVPLSGKNPPINQNRQKLHTNGTDGKSQFKSTADADKLTEDAWANGVPQFNKNNKFTGKIKDYDDTVGLNSSEKSVSVRFSRKHGIHGFPTVKKAERY